LDQLDQRATKAKRVIRVIKVQLEQWVCLEIRVRRETLDQQDQKVYLERRVSMVQRGHVVHQGTKDLAVLRDRMV